MDSLTRTWSDVVGAYTQQSLLDGTKSDKEISRGKLTYGGFISLLQSLGLDHHSTRGEIFGTPVGRGRYFSVYRHVVLFSDYRAMRLAVSIPGQPLFERECAELNTCVAIKRVIVNKDATEVDISDHGQMHALCREITALVHPALRDQDNIVKLQAIIWEDGLSTGNESGFPMWPSLVMEFCETTLAEYQLHNPPIERLQRGIICGKIGQGLDALHSVDIFHGDLKSENILLKVNSNGALEPKLADFGCSITFLDDNGKTRYYVTGTPMWWAPECPDYFTNINDIEATDTYSLGLLWLRVLADGRNPFEEFGVIPEDWSPTEKLGAVQFLKETDSMYALICGNEGFENIPVFAQLLANMLLKDPKKRMSNTNEMNINVEHLRSMVIQETDSAANVSEFQRLSDGWLEDMESSKLKPTLDDLATPEEEILSISDPFSIWSIYASESFVPNCGKLSSLNNRVTFNEATRTRVVKEIAQVLYDGTHIHLKRCSECCSLTMIDKYPNNLTVETLLDEVQKRNHSALRNHTCSDLVGHDVPIRDLEISRALYGGTVSADIVRKAMAALQLFLATATGFGTQQNPSRALEILEDAATAGLTGLCTLYYHYSLLTDQTINPALPLRSWLVLIVLFQDGVPSPAFSALEKLDLVLAGATKLARSKVYNGSTASFNNLKFNSLDAKDNPGVEVPPGFFQPEDRPYFVQDEIFENTLLHLVAGSDGADLSMISYCINVLKIDKDVRNLGGATPLLLACRAGREDKILALLELGASVNLSYTGGETPLHWLGLLTNPSQLLKEFLKRNADINAQVKLPALLPNFVGGTKSFYLAGGPIVWAMAMKNYLYIDALLSHGANIHHPGPTGLTAINVACIIPQLSRFLPRLSTEKSFQITHTDAYRVITWDKMNMVLNFVSQEEQEKLLRWVLSIPNPFKNLEEALEFYWYLIPKAVSDCRIEILELVIEGLRKSTSKVKHRAQDLDQYIKLPLSHTRWTHHRLTHEAASRGDVDILKVVLKNGGDAVGVDDFGRTALHVASQCSENPECVDVLITNGTLEIIDRQFDLHGWTAFTIAVANCNFSVADRLLSYTTPKERRELLSSHAARGMTMNGLSMIGHFIVWSHVFGERPLAYLFNLPDIRDDINSVFIVNEDRRIHALIAISGCFSDGAVYDAEYFAASRRKRAYDFLLRNFSESSHINAVDIEKNTALHISALVGNSVLATALMDRGAEVNALNAAGDSPLDSLFVSFSPFHQSEKVRNGLIMEAFEKGRKDIYMELTARGGRSNRMTQNVDGPTYTSSHQHL